MPKHDVLHPVTGEVIGYEYREDAAPSPWARYSWKQFMEILQGSGKARKWQAAMRAGDDRADDLAHFMALNQARGVVDFADQFNRDVFNALVPDVASQAQVDNFINAE